MARSGIGDGRRFWRAAALLGLLGLAGCHALFSHEPGRTDGPTVDRAPGETRPREDGPTLDAPRPDAPSPDAQNDGPKPDAQNDGPKPDAQNDGPKPDTPNDGEPADCPKSDYWPKLDSKKDLAPKDGPTSDYWPKLDSKKDTSKPPDLRPPDSKPLDLPRAEGSILDLKADGLAGPSWKSVTHGLGTTMLLGIWGGGPNEILAVGKGCAIWHWNGTVWKSITKPATCAADLRGVWGSAGTYHAVGDGGMIVKITLAPVLAVVVTSGTSNLLWSVWGASTLTAVGDAGTVRSASGNPWVADQAGIPASSNLRDVWGLPSLHVIVGKSGTGGPVLYTRAPLQSATWSPATLSGTSNTAALRSIFGFSTTEVVVVGDQGTVVRNNGSGWVASPKGISVATILHGLWASDSSHYVAVGTTTSNACGGGASALGTSAVHHFASSATTNLAPLLPAGTGALCGVWGSAWNNIYAVGHGGVIIRYAP